jgi:hypothetical protein
MPYHRGLKAAFVNLDKLFAAPAIALKGADTPSFAACPAPPKPVIFLRDNLIFRRAYQTQ